MLLNSTATQHTYPVPYSDTHYRFIIFDCLFLNLRLTLTTSVLHRTLTV